MTEDENEIAAAELAEKSNGGKWNDPNYYAPSHKAYWRARVAGTSPDKQMPSDLKTASKQKIEQTAVTPAEVNEFSSHCVFIRLVYVMGMRIWRDSNESERKTMEALAPSLFHDFSSVLGEFLIIAVSRITDPAVDSKGNENFTVELLQRACPREDKAPCRTGSVTSAHERVAGENLARAQQTWGARRSRNRSCRKTTWRGELERMG